MTELVLKDVADEILRELEDRAAGHGRTPEEEAKAILSESLQGRCEGDWSAVDDIHARLAASGRVFSDSTELLREDRDR